MKTTTFNIYKSTDGQLRLDNHTSTYKNEDWEQYLKDTNQTERLERLLSMSSRKRSPKIWKLRKSQDFLQWQEGRDITITSELYGVASADHDGRVPEWGIKKAILEALRYGEKEARYYPTSNANKPAQERLVYVFNYTFKKKKYNRLSIES